MPTEKILKTSTLEKVQHVIVGGVKTACLSRSELTKLMVEDCMARRKIGAEKKVSPALIFDSNGHGLSMAATNKSYQSDLAQADIVHADGRIIVAVTNKFTNGNISDRSATTDFFHDAALAAVEHGLTFFLLGATEETNAACTVKLQEMYPGLNIIGRRNGYFTTQEEADICKEISRLKPDIVWVGLGKPKEQRFCVKHQDDIQAGWLITCGGCYSYVTGDYPRAPLWMQNSGLEWLHRMWTNPQKLFWRYLTTNPHALYLIMTKTRKKKVV